MIELVPLGDRGYLGRFVSEELASRYARILRTEAWPGLTDVTVAYKAVGILFDPDRVDVASLETRLLGLDVSRNEPTVEGRRIVIPTLYDGDDLESSALALDLTAAELVDLHTSLDYQVFAIGFLPGFPYAGYLSERLSGLSRRPTPRTRVPAGSVAIVGRQTAIYPGESPGGWHLIGRTPICLVDVADNFFPIAAGDRLRFEQIEASEFNARKGERL